MLKELKDIINSKSLMDGVYFSEEVLYGRGGEIIEQAKHAIIYAIMDCKNWEDSLADLKMFSDLIGEIESRGWENQYIKVSYNVMGGFIVELA